MAKYHRSKFKNIASDKIKILQVIGNMNRGGAETFLMNVLRNINREKFEFVFLCYKSDRCDYEKEIYDLGGRIVWIEQPSQYRIIRNVNNIIKVIKDEKIDVVHAHTYYNSCYAIIAAKMCKIRMRITHSHNTKSDVDVPIIKRMYFKISKYIINKFSTDKYACGEEAGKALFYGEFKIIENGIEIEKFVYSEKTALEKRKEQNISEDATVIGHVGRFDKVKNHSFLIDIFCEFLKLNSNSILLLVGDGVLKNAMIEKTRKLGIKNKVIFLGIRSDVNELYNVMDLFVFPSIFEGLPVTLIEAQTNGLRALISKSISEDANITGTIEFIDLKEDKSKWANKIYEASQNTKRIDTIDIIKNSKYDIKKNVRQIEEYYYNISERG